MKPLSERLKDRLIYLMEAGRLTNEVNRLPILLEHGRFALEELKEVIQLEADNAAFEEKLSATQEFAKCGVENNNRQFEENARLREALKWIWSTSNESKIAGIANKALKG